MICTALINKLAFPILMVFCLLSINCSSDQRPKAQAKRHQSGKPIPSEKNYRRMNDNLDNFTIRSAYSDMEMFRRNNKPVYSISYYKAESSENNPRKLKKIGGKDFYLQAYTEYLADGRKRYKTYIYDHIQRIENYHYDEQFQNLLLLHRVEPDQENEKNYYHLLNYYPNKLLKEEIRYRTYKGTNFDLEGYTAYTFKKNKAAITISVNNIGYDSIPAPQERYTFEGSKLTKQKPLYQSKKQYLKWIDSAYKPIQITGYIFDYRNVDFTYDDNGYITSETWIENGELAHKKEFDYRANYTERVEQLYQQRGTEKSTRYLRKYNKQGDLVLEQTVEYTGNKPDPVVFEYVYDENNNWTERKKFKLSASDSNAPTLLLHEIREITYFENDTKIRSIPFPRLAEKAALVAKSLPKAARKKQRWINQFNKAQEEGRYDIRIVKTEAREIKDFTPKFWKLKATAFGDLDKLEGDEAIAVFETPSPGDIGFKQMLAIFRKKGNNWILWHQTDAPILGTQGGGTMGNPFDRISIANSTILINHFGGSRQKWRYRHVYRYQNQDWYLIGASVHFGAPCDYFIDFDYNLSTGEAIAAYQQEICNNDKEKAAAKQWTERFKRRITLPRMDDFIPGDHKFAVPGLDDDIYY